MDFGEFVAQLSLDWDAVLTLAGFLAVGIFGTIQTLKVLRVVKDQRQAGIASLTVAGLLGSLVVGGYFFPAFLPVGLAVYGIVLATDAAALGYKYLAKPVVTRLFPKAEVSVSDLSGE